MRRSLALLLSSLIPISGCASYTPSSAPIPKGADMLAWHSEGGLAVGADPYVAVEQQKAVFDVNLMEGGVLAINLLVQNDSDRQFLVRRSDILLVLPDGTQLRPAGGSQAASKMESGAGGVIGATVAFGLVGFLLAQSAHDKAEAARQADYLSKEFKDATLGKGESAYGFVYFIPPVGTSSFNEGTLKVRWVDAKEATTTTIPLVITGLGFKGVPGERKEESAPTVAKPEASKEANSQGQGVEGSLPKGEEGSTVAQDLALAGSTKQTMPKSGEWLLGEWVGTRESQWYREDVTIRVASYDQVTKAFKGDGILLVDPNSRTRGPTTNLVIEVVVDDEGKVVMTIHEAGGGSSSFNLKRERESTLSGTTSYGLPRLTLEKKH